MAITYGYFNSINGDRKYNADQMSNYFQGLVSDGVYETVGNKLQVLALSGMEVGVQTGRALLDCKWLNNDAVHNITINAAHVLLNRYTAIVMKLDKSARTIDIIAKDGENASNPIKPTMINTTSVIEYCLAYIYVKAGTTTISQSDITDMRGSSLCPWVTGVVKQVDTSQLFLQYQTAYEEYAADMRTWMDEQKAEFDAWMATLTEELKVNTYLKEYRNIITVSEETLTLMIGIDEYNPNTDILYASINGILFVEGEEYVVSGIGATAKIEFKNTIKPNNIIEFRVLKSMIGIQS